MPVRKPARVATPALGLALLCCAFSLLASPASGAPLLDAAARQDLQACLDGAIARLGVPGAVMLIRAPDGAVWIGSSGYGSLDPASIQAGADGQPPAWRGVPMDPGLKFQIASITKTFTAHLVLQLAQEGRLSLEDRLDRWLPGVIQMSDRITIRQLLNHTAGVYNFSDEEFHRTVYNNPDKPWTRQELLDIARAHGPDFAPGKGWKYSNTGYVLLGMIVEQASGQSFDEALESRILRPLGIKASVADKRSLTAEQAQYARGYVYMGRRDPDRPWKDYTVIDPSALSTAANMVSSLDLLTWLDALLSGKLLNDRYRQEMFSFVPTGMDGFTYGMGVMNCRGAVGHTGCYFSAYTSAIFRYRDCSFVVLVNGNAMPGRGTQNAAEDIFWKATKTLFADRPILAGAPAAPAEAAKLTGSAK